MGTRLYTEKGSTVVLWMCAGDRIMECRVIAVRSKQVLSGAR
jgi:putative component of toxin-antitoxin plasmid stabilization module